MVTLVLIYAIIAGVAALRGYKSPLFGACGIVLYIILQFPAAAICRMRRSGPSASLLPSCR
jgi:type IV secretory pathway VirB2 component (pilin)